MALTTDQRLDSLQVRLTELTFWRDRAYVDLDGWTFDGEPWRPGEPWPRREGPVRLAHGEVRLPAGWSVEDSRLNLDLGGEGLLRIRYADSREEPWGLDAFHRRFPLLGPAFTLEVDAVPRLPFGVPSRNARLERARLGLLDRVVDRLIRQIRLIIWTIRALRGQEVVEPLIALGEEALLALDWPSATAPYLARTAGSDLMLRIWELPRDIDLHPPDLTDAQRRTAAAASELIERRLSELRNRYPPQGALAATGQAHLDLAWLWPMDETRRKARRTASTALGLMERFPDFTFHMSAAQNYAFMAEDDPALLDRIKERAATGQWEPVGGMWVEPDLNMPAGESLVRQLLYGQRFFERTFGRRHTVAWLPDCFGFSAALPQLLRGAGIDSFFTIKVNWSETNAFPYDLFWWEGIDGSRVLAHTVNTPSPPGAEGLGGYNASVDPISAEETWRRFRGKHLYGESLFSYGYGDGGGGPSAEMLETMDEMARFPALPALRPSRIRDFYARLRQGIENEQLPVWFGEMYLELHRGTFTSQGRTKFLHRRAEHALVAAEVVSGLLALLGGDEPVSLEPQWRIVLRNEFHDILPGSSIREVYEVTNAELQGVVDEATAVIDRKLGALAGRLVPSGNEEALLVVNPDLSPRQVKVELPHEFPGAQTVEGGSVLTEQGSISGLGIRLISGRSAAANLEVSERRLENDLIRVSLGEDGSLMEVWDKVRDRPVLAGRGNQLWAYVDKPRVWDAWDLEAGFERSGKEITSVSSIEIVERGPHRAAIRVERRFRNSSIRQNIRLWAGSSRIDIHTTLDWHDRHFLLKARFPLAVQAREATCETAFGTIRRPTHRNTSWEQARFEVVAHRFVDLSEPGYGVALLNDGKYGHDIAENQIGMSLLRSPVYPDPYADEGTQTFTYAVYPHQSTWLEGGVLAEAEDLNRPLLSRRVRAERAEDVAWTPLRLEGLPLGLGTLKVLEDRGGLLLRVYEPQGSRGDVHVELPEGWSPESEANLLEDVAGEAGFSFTPFQVRSWVLRQ